MDLIDRQAAIAVADSSDYVWLSVEDVKKVTDEVVKGLKRLPSAHPKISCDGCRYCGRPTTDMPCCGCIRKESNDYYQPDDRPNKQTGDD